MQRPASLARRLFDRFEAIHGITYFAPECRQAMDDLGYRGFWMGYFAARSAPLGPVPPPVVAALFYNFAVTRVTKALPAAWDVASPAAVLGARLDAAVAALRRYGLAAPDTLEHTRTAADLCARAARTAPVDGRALFAAYTALPWPEDPVAVLWHAATLLREHRGDGHNAALLSLGVSGRESNVLHCAAGVVPAAYIRRSRDYDDEEWDGCVRALAARGLLDGGGALTAAGQAVKDRIEELTDTAALSAFATLADAEVEQLFRALTPIARLVVAAGDLPAATPMGLRRHELADDSAHLG